MSTDRACSNFRTHNPIRKRSFSEASTVISPDVPDMSSISLSDFNYTTDTSSTLTASEVRTNSSFYCNFPHGHVMRVIGQ
jgi:hypothetical protein